jgi:Spy/CpxP family protein refolding chaperone
LSSYYLTHRILFGHHNQAGEDYMHRLRTLTLGFLASTAVFTTFNFCVLGAQAQPMPNWGDGPEHEAKMGCPIECEPWPEKLDLTDEQMEKLIDLKSDYEIKTAEKKAQLLANMKHMALLMTDTKADKEAILSLNEKNNALKSELSVARTHKMLDAMAIMTTKQKEQIHHHMLVHMLSHQPMGGKHHHSTKHHH